jgi:preprotein translocase subunit SecG
MSTILTILHVLVCLFLVLTVLLQAGKGGGMGAAFGGGSSSGTVFGGSGAGNFLKKLTVGAAIVFVATSMSLAYLASSSGSDSLKAYSAQQRRNAELKKQRHEQATQQDGAGAMAPGDGDLVDPLDTPGELFPSTGEGAALEEKPPTLPEADKTGTPKAPSDEPEPVLVPSP